MEIFQQLRNHILHKRSSRFAAFLELIYVGHMPTTFVSTDYLKFTSLPFRYYIYSMKFLLTCILHCIGYLHSIDYCSSIASVWPVSFHEEMLGILPQTTIFAAQAPVTKTP